jgi:hypothetical protein
VLRTAPWVGLNDSLLVPWYLRVHTDLKHLGLPPRPWYRSKLTVSFADVLSPGGTETALHDSTEIPSSPPRMELRGHPALSMI